MNIKLSQEQINILYSLLVCDLEYIENEEDIEELEELKSIKDILEDKVNF